MLKQESLKPVDVAVVLSLAIKGGHASATYSELGNTLGVSSSTTHESVDRLQKSGLLRPGTREPNLHELRNFLVHGVRHAFPPSLGREAKGVPTAHSGPPLSELFESAKPVVWPDVRGGARGTSLAPLYPNATQLPERAPELYVALTLVDALRVGQARERNAALSALDQVLGLGDARDA